MRRLWCAESDAQRHQLLDVSYAARGRVKPADAKVRGGRGDEAQWWLLDEDGRTVSCLLCYPQTFSMPDGTVLAGFGLGAVSTVPDATRRGYANWLCGEVGRIQAEAGRHIGLLYSAIPQAYYERLGYRVARAADWCTSELDAVAGAVPAARLVQVDPMARRAVLLERYAAHHRGLLSLLRNPTLHDRTLRLNPDDTWHLCDGGYVRLEVDGSELEIIELIVDETRVPGVLAACAEQACALGLTALRGWLEPSPFVERHLERRSRERTLPMVLGTPPNPSRFWSSDYF